MKRASIAALLASGVALAACGEKKEEQAAAGNRASGARPRAPRPRHNGSCASRPRPPPPLQPVATRRSAFCSTSPGPIAQLHSADDGFA